MARLLATIISILIVFAGVWVGRQVYDRVKLPGGINWPSLPSLGRQSSEPANSKEAEKAHLAFGNPSNAKPDGSNKDNFLMVTDAYALSYNDRKGTPNWVSWRITEDDLGNLERQNDFQPDESLPPGWKEVSPSDYTGSGYDRGHLCPSGDRSNDPDKNSLTFLMTNIAPQTGDLNRYPWERLESYARGLVRRGHVDLYVVAGVYGEKEKLKARITVPTNFWKIIIALPQGGTIADVNENSHVIAVDMPNIEGISQKDWRSYRTSVKAIEHSTGYNFFSTLPQRLQDVLKTRTRD